MKELSAEIKTKAMTGYKEGRIGWVDVAKGLGILLVIYGHMLTNHGNGYWGLLSKVIYSFHIPMFFILSGYLSHRPKETSVTYIKKKAYEFLFPTLASIVLTIPIYIYYIIINYYSVDKIIKTLFFVDGQIMYNGSVWFLIVIFEVILIFNFIKGADFSLVAKSLMVLVCFAAEYFIYTYNIALIFGLEKTIIALGFYFVGSIISDIDKKLLPKVRLIIVCCSVVIWIVYGCILNTEVSLYQLKFGNYFYYIIAGITGSIGWFGLCYILRKVVLFRLWGQNTIFIIGTHYFGVTAVGIIAKNIGFTDTIYYDIITLIISVGAMFMYIPICQFINKYLPLLNGRQANSKVTG